MEKEARDREIHVDEKDVISDSSTDVDNEGHLDDNSTHEKVPDDTVKTTEAAEPEHVYISGLQLWLVISSVTLVVFLMLLDISIIVTVSLGALSYKSRGIDSHNRLFPKLPATSTRCQMLDGMVVRIFLQGEFLHIFPHYVPQLTRTNSCALQPLTGKIYSEFSTKACCPSS